MARGEVRGKCGGGGAMTCASSIPSFIARTCPSPTRIPFWSLEYEVPGLGLGVWGLEFGVLGLGFGAWGLGFGVWGLGFGV